MTQSMQMADFFAMEAGEYLERLDGLVSPSDPPDPEQFHDIARALRGSALMAGQHQVARVAGGLEAVARGVKATTLTWDEPLRQLTIRAVDDLKVLVRAVGNWGTSEDARVHGIATELEKVAGSTPAGAHVSTQELDPGTRAFIAREGAAVGSALDLAAKTLTRNPTAVDALDAVMRALQPLRGIASLSDLPPMADLLDGIERAVQELMRREEPATNPGAVFDAAAKAVSRASQEITTQGQADPDSAEAAEFANQLGVLLDMGPNVVPVESLYHADAGPHIVTQGTPPTAGAPGQLEMVSLAERLKQAADDLGSAQSNTQRQLRAHALAPTLRALASAGPEAAQMVNALRDAVARGVAMSDPGGLGEQLRQASAALTNWSEDQASALGLAAITHSLRGLGEGAAAATPAPPAAPATPAEPASLATASRPTASSAPAPPSSADTPAQAGLAASMDVYHQLSVADGGGQAPLEKLFAGPPTTATAPPEPATDQLPPITEYCYTGPAALRRVLELRERLPGSANDEADQILQEIFDLVALGLETSA